MVKFNNDWDQLLNDEFTKPYYLKLREFLISEYQSKIIYPSMHDIFNAFKLSSYQNTQVVIMGQDPYHNPHQAHGLAFSVLQGLLPPSLKNIYYEIEKEFNITMSKNGNLTTWAKQGVLLLNSVLTVRQNQANSHKNYGWEIFTNKVISLLNERSEAVIFLLWGRDAKEKEKLITNKHHFILKAAHPSPLSAHHGFFGCNHFLKTNEILKSLNKKEINWLN